jgi:DNA-binding NarL/FixJ family response regulator
VTRVDSEHVPSSLTERQRCIVLLLAYGFSNDEIARRLLVSQRSVRVEIAQIYEKLEPSRDRAQIVVRLAHQNPLTSVGAPEAAWGSFGRALAWRPLWLRS